jgi:predicted Zn-dependent peptidase
LKIAPLKYRQRTPANGLMVLSIENYQSPTVAIQVWYHVGGKDDPLRRSKFAPLFEHMMFKSAKNQKNENFDRLTEDVGGANNAFTEDDYTVYHETVPSNYLEPLLWAEADRMANLDVNEPNFVSERAALMKSELARLAMEPVADSELIPRKAALSGNFARGLEIAAGLVSAVATLTECDLPVSSISDYLPRVQKVTPAEIERFAGKNLRADDGSVVIFGDLRQFKSDLNSRFPNAQIISVDKLNLNSGSLVKP